MNTSVPVKCDTSYDNATSYADRCRNVCNRDCAKEASLIPELDGTLLICSQNNNSDKYCNEELQNDTPKGNSNNNNKFRSSNKGKERNRRRESSKHDNDSILQHHQKKRKKKTSLHITKNVLMNRDCV